jgi:hypothetical protein
MTRRGYVDPAIVPTTVREEHILREIVASGLRLEFTRPGSRSMRLQGPDVDVLVTKIGSIQEFDVPSLNWRRVGR